MRRHGDSRMGGAGITFSPRQTDDCVAFYPIAHVHTHTHTIVCENEQEVDYLRDGLFHNNNYNIKEWSGGM
jgi:hypothetical protein